MAKAQQPEKESFWKRLKQIGMVVSFTAKRDRLFVPLVLAVVLVPLGGAAAGIATGFMFGWAWLPIGILMALLGFMIVLNLRSNKAMLGAVEGKPGASLSVVKSLRGDWRVHEHIAMTTQQDMVHLIISRAGIVLLGEGDPSRVRGLVNQERRRLSKLIGNTELRDFTIGRDEGQIPLGKLKITLLKLPRTVTAKDVNSLDKRITALTSRPQMPKGAVKKNMIPPKLGGSSRPR